MPAASSSAERRSSSSCIMGATSTPRLPAARRHCIIRPVKAPDAGRLHEWLADPRVTPVDPPTVKHPRERLTARTDTPLVHVAPHGTVAVRDAAHRGAAPRRLLQLERGGAVLAALRWAADG